MMELIQRLLALLREGTLPVMLPLVAVCIGTFALIVERSLYLYGFESFLLWWWPPAARKLAVLRRRRADAIEDYLAHPTLRTRRAAIDACEKVRSPYSSFVASVLRDETEFPASLRELHLAQVGVTAVARIEERLQMLATCAKVAPLLGLLGTVTGMIQTFRVMMLVSTSDPRALSSGISIALIATEVGLIVSLPGVIGTSWLHRRAKTLIEEIQLASMRFRQIHPVLRTGNPGRAA